MGLAKPEWIKMTAELNGLGPTKTRFEWQCCWRSLKSSVRKKLRNPTTNTHLDILDMRVKQILNLEEQINKRNGLSTCNDVPSLPISASDFLDPEEATDPLWDGSGGLKEEIVENEIFPITQTYVKREPLVGSPPDSPTSLSSLLPSDITSDVINQVPTNFAPDTGSEILSTLKLLLAAQLENNKLLKTLISAPKH